MTALNFLVFREGRRTVHSQTLLSALHRNLSSEFNASTALLRAAELECALFDVEESNPNWTAFTTLTDSLAESLLNDDKNLISLIHHAPLPNTLTISPPEGFAYYGLHPLAYAKVLEKLVPLAPRVVIAGIRTIGTTLSAICCAAARKRGVQAQRFTVRPKGHPYDRKTRFTPEQLALVQREAGANADFFVVDEGPGLSGSSFLSVGEALEQAGALREKITFICGHEPNVNALCAPDSVRRWQGFRSVAVSSDHKPEGAQIWIGAGEWRRHFLSHEALWPASWLSFERPKYLSVLPEKCGTRACPRVECRRALGCVESLDNQNMASFQKKAHENLRFYKFTGLGHYGEAVLEREAFAAEAGFAPQPIMESHGFASYPLVNGRPMSAHDLSQPALKRMAEYCAFRRQHFKAEFASVDGLQQMAEHNLSQLKLGISVRLNIDQPVVADGRMAPHEWLLQSSGRMLKTDSGTHGDDHFFPGVTDIAWDLAGAIIEWKMDHRAEETFLEMYRKASSDDATPRVREFIKAYTVFRCAYCLMAANAMQGTGEQARLEQAADGYRILLESVDCPAEDDRVKMYGEWL